MLLLLVFFGAVTTSLDGGDDRTENHFLEERRGRRRDARGIKRDNKNNIFVFLSRNHKLQSWGMRKSKASLYMVEQMIPKSWGLTLGHW